MENNRKSIPNYSKYEMGEDDVIYSASTGKVIQQNNGEVRLYNEAGRLLRLKVADLKKATIDAADVSSIMEKHQQVNPDKKPGITEQIRQLSRDGLTRKEISAKIMPNRGFVDGVVYKMNFDNNKDAIIEDLKTMSVKEIQNKYDVAPRFIKPLLDER